MMTAYVVAPGLPAPKPRNRFSGSAWALLIAVLAQAALGIWTLIEVVPLPLGIAHQAGAVIVFGVAVWHLHEMRQSQT